MPLRHQMWEYGRKSVSLHDQINHLAKLRKSNSHYSKHPQDMQAQTIKRVNAAYEHFQRRCEAGAEKKGYPRYKRSVRSLSWSLRKSKKGVRQQPIGETDSRLNRLKVPKLGKVKIRQHRRFIGDPKEVTLKKTVRGWYCFIVCEVPDTPKCVLKSACGVDVGTHDFLTTCEGEKIPNPRFYRRAEQKLAKLQRELSRKQYRSRRWYKAKDALAKQADRVACQRLDFIAKTVYKLFHHKDFDALVAEKLKPKNMVKNRHLAKSISDASWGMFFDWCDWVSKRDGKHFHQVPPQNTSQTCSECCQKSAIKLKLSERIFHCKSCGLKLDRDHNAAKNILYRAACALRGEVWDAILYHLWCLGDMLTEFNCVVRSSDGTDNLKDGTLLFPTYQSQPDSYEYAEYRACSLSDVGDYDARWLVNSWELDNYDEKTFPLLYGNYVRSVADLPDKAQESDKKKYQQDHNREMGNPVGTTASFTALAKSADGAELIGCLRMDVDDSSGFFSGGESNLGLGIAVSSNLSRSMNLFFKGYLNAICGRKLGMLGKQDHPLNISESSETGGRNVSIVYAGGDDLFIVGVWDDVAEVAFDINVCFRAFSCWNPDVHLSGGVTLHKPKFPLYQMANMAKRAENTAKANENSETGEKKNSFSLFYSDSLKTLNRSLNERIDAENKTHSTWEQVRNRIAIACQWDEYNQVIQLTKRLCKVYAELPHRFYLKLFETLKIWQEDDILYMPMMVHTLRQLDQMQSQNPEFASLKTLLFQQEHVHKLHIPLHWVEYLNRQIGGED